VRHVRAVNPEPFPPNPPPPAQACVLFSPYSHWRCALLPVRRANPPARVIIGVTLVAAASTTWRLLLVRRAGLLALTLTLVLLLLGVMRWQHMAQLWRCCWVC
jgi:hypothetical protein